MFIVFFVIFTTSYNNKDSGLFGNSTFEEPTSNIMGRDSVFVSLLLIWKNRVKSSNWTKTG